MSVIIMSLWGIGLLWLIGCWLSHEYHVERTG